MDSNNSTDTATRNYRKRSPVDRSPISDDAVKQPSLEGNGKANSVQVNRDACEAVNDLIAAKFAATRVVELVNKKNVGGGTGILTTEQKKKLLWGNKKSSAATEESAVYKWDVSQIVDPERQEKFNKLMGVKGSGSSSQDGSSVLQAEKQKELQMDLEKQYTAGLQRTDGRTVGLGL